MSTFHYSFAAFNMLTAYSIPATAPVIPMAYAASTTTTSVSTSSRPPSSISSLSFLRSISTLQFPPPPPPRQRLHLSSSSSSSSSASSPTALLKRSPKRLKYSAQRLFKKGEGMAYLKMDPMREDTWKLDPIIEMIRKGAVGVIPTDTVYAIVCDLKNHSSIERLRRIKGIGYSKPLSILCHSLQGIDTYTMGFPRGNSQGQTNIFRAVKHCLPGPYTFILPASKQLPKQCIRNGPSAKYAQRKQVGVRIPDDTMCHAILQNLDAPLICTSVKWPAEDQWMLDPVIIADIYEPEGLDFVVDGGIRVSDPSTVVDMTGSCPTIVRQGKGPKLEWMVMEGEDPLLQAA